MVIPLTGPSQSRNTAGQRPQVGADGSGSPAGHSPASGLGLPETHAEQVQPPSPVSVTLAPLNGPPGELSRRGRWRRVLFGRPRDPSDHSMIHRLSLVAFLAWVGLGADGLSSASYGPAEAFLALGSETYLAIALAMI